MKESTDIAVCNFFCLPFVFVVAADFFEMSFIIGYRIPVCIFFASFGSFKVVNKLSFIVQYYFSYFVGGFYVYLKLWSQLIKA
jgi:hypothetical protein